MRLLLKRRFLAETYTIGSLYVNGLYFSDTIEDKVRDLNKDGDLNDLGEGKIYGKTAIPYSPPGKPYKIELSMSPKFKRMLPLLLDVPHFTGIRIHKMGTDTKPGTAEWSEGCIGPGENKVKGGIIHSAFYETKLVEMMREAILMGEEIEIEII